MAPFAPPLPSTGPPVRPGDCRVCGAATHGPFALCFCCTLLVGQLRMPLVPLVAAVDYRVHDGIHRRLRSYKDAFVAEQRRVYRQDLAGLIGPWMASSGPGLRRRFGSGWDVVTTVPSSRRPAGSPVDAVIDEVPQLRALRRPLLVLGPCPTDHLVAGRKGFELARGVDPSWLRGRSVLVMDDSVTTGARAQSAAAALRIGGARVPGIVVIGRAVAA